MALVNENLSTTAGPGTCLNCAVGVRVDFVNQPILHEGGQLLTMPRIRPASARADQRGVGLGDGECLCDLSDSDGSEAWQNLLNVAFLIQPFGQT